jgi:MerC mercury resistance protein
MVAAMIASFQKTGRLDRIAMGLSGLCLVHCIATGLILGLLASAGGFLANPLIHEVGLGFAMLLAILALGRGALTHRSILPMAIGAVGLGFMARALSLPEGKDVLMTMVGVGLLILAHTLNCRASEHHACLA